MGFLKDSSSTSENASSTLDVAEGPGLSRLNSCSFDTLNMDPSGLITLIVSHNDIFDTKM